MMCHLRNSSFNNSDYSYNELKVVSEIIDLASKIVHIKHEFKLPTLF
jgi:hypothetical protein